jgi:hypothetical protein
MAYRVSRYAPEHREAWQRFVAASRNGTFLFDRDFMEYHSARFEDHSLLLHDASGGLAGVMPANVAGRTLTSHGGLTYGGLVVNAAQGSVQVLAMLTAARDALREWGFERLVYKTVPWIYHRQPAEEDRYALFRLGARLERRDVLSVVPCEERLPFQQRRARGVRAALKAGVSVGESRDFEPYWEVLTEVLQSRHGTKPAHSASEISHLARTFPDAIRLFIARVQERIVGGVIVFATPRVAHVQYIAANEEGRRTHALDAVFARLLAEEFRDVAFFDFGISNEDGGRVLNEGLVSQKEGFGARTVVHDFYELDVR